jgi:hypothetical protein
VAAVLLGETRSEFLANPALVRFFSGPGGTPSLAVKAPALQLKYFVAAERLSLLLLPLNGGHLAYAVAIPDDPDDYAYVWSMVENDDEIAALHTLLDGSPCSLHLFNEIAINVASTTAQFDGDLATVAHELNADGHIQKASQTQKVPTADVVDGINVLHRGNSERHHGWRLNAELKQTWDHATTFYYSNGHTPTYLSLSDANEGAQQEALCLWLTDTFAPQGAHLNPAVAPEKGGPSRELCDVLLTFEGYSFVIESKALAVLTRPKVPTRNELRGDVVRHVGKAAKQISGALRYLRLGYPVTDHRGNDVDIDREKPLHLIILIPDLTLLSASDGLGNVFLARLIQKTGCFVHLLDPTQLLRVVQAATMIARRYSHVSEIAALDWYLGKRLERALDLDTPAFDFLLRFGDGNEPQDARSST